MCCHVSDPVKLSMNGKFKINLKCHPRMMGLAASRKKSKICTASLKFIVTVTALFSNMWRLYHGHSSDQWEKLEVLVCDRNLKW